jgi:hypothetical protein
VVLDFETTGLSPDNGDRTIEIGAVLVRDNQVVNRFQILMNPGKRISLFIQEYTGITNAMLKKRRLPPTSCTNSRASWPRPHWWLTMPVMESEDAIEGVMPFIERREADFKGR